MQKNNVLDHKAFLSTLTPAQRLELLEKSDQTGLLHFIGHAGLIVLLGSLIALRVPFWPVLMPLQGIALIFTFTLMHECTHNTPFKTVWLNTLIGHVIGFILILPFGWFRYFHLAHHRYTHNPNKDPELATPKPNTLKGYLWHVSGIPVWASQIRTVLRNGSGGCKDGFVPAKRRAKIQIESIILVILYILTFITSFNTLSILATCWILPIILGQPFLRLYLLAEHGDCPHVANMFENSRTTFTNSAVKFLAWNMPYHAEHHAYPTVPFHRLPALHNAVVQHLRTTENGYTAFHSKYISRLKSSL